jgi:hypothetical protein
MSYAASLPFVLLGHRFSSWGIKQIDFWARSTTSAWDIDLHQRVQKGMMPMAALGKSWTREFENHIKSANEEH